MRTEGLCGTGGIPFVPFDLEVDRVGDDICICGFPYTEFKVEVDLFFELVPFVLESWEDFSVLKLALERRRRSLKKGMTQLDYEAGRE